MSRNLRIAIFTALVLLTLADFAVSLHWVIRYPAIDERVRIVGARLLLNHLNAYAFTTPEPNPFYRQFAANTYTPFLLLLYAPLRWRPYETQRLLLFALDWLCLAALYLLTRTWWKPADRAIHAAAFMILVLADLGVLLHMERGQYYILLSTLIAAAITTWRRSRLEMLGALAAGAVIAIRPTFLLIVPLLWILRFRSQAYRTLAMACLLAGATMLAFGLQPWRDYEGVLSKFQNEVARYAYPSNTTSPPKPDAAEFQYKQVEGQDFTQNIATPYFADRSFLQVAWRKGAKLVTRRLFATPQILVRANSTFLALTALCCLLLAYLLRAESADIKLGFVFLAPTLAETFAPTKQAYGDVTLAPTLLLMLAVLTVHRGMLERFQGPLRAMLAMCLITFAGVLLLFRSESFALFPLSLARWMACMLFAIWFFVRTGLRAANEKKDAASRPFASTMARPAEGGSL